MTSPHRKWAILVGIDFYVDQEFRLKGACNDVELMELYLSKNHELHSLTKFLAICHDPAQTTLEEPESTWPTYENIARELKRITEEASPGDLVYFHYSGHGTLSPTNSREYREDSGSDAALVLYNPRSESGVRFMRGIELASLLDKMVDKGLNLTVILDCCHSGSVSRGSAITHRGMPWNERVASAYPPIYDPESLASRPIPPAENASRDASTQEHWLVKPRGYTMIAACSPTETASEIQRNDGKSQGALTHFLSKALSAVSKRPEISLAAIYRQICAQIHVSRPQQHPMLLGSKTSGFLTVGSGAQNTRSVCSVTNVTPDGLIWLNVGRAQGVSLGDEYEIYPMALVEKTTRPDCPKYRITAVHALHSEAEQFYSPAGRSIKPIKGWNATLFRPLRPKAQVALAPESDDNIRDLVHQSHWLELADAITVVPASLPSFEVRLTANNDYAIFINTTDSVQNLPVIAASDSDAPRKVVTVLEHLAKYASIEGLDNEESGSSLQANPAVQTKSIDEDQQDDFSIDLKSKDDPRKRLIGNTLYADDGERITVSFQNNTARSLYLTIFDMKPLRGVSKLYPSSDRGYSKEVPAKSEEFSGKVSFTMRMRVPESLKKGSKVQVEDVLKFFVTTRPTATSLEALELPELSEQLLGKVQRSGSDQSLLNALEDPSAFVGANGGLRSGSNGETDSWTCRNYIIQTAAAG